jgi:Trk K+ transport system NAD-binding subunit
VLIGEGIVRFGLLMLSRRRGEKEWMNVMASTYRDHIILAGLGHLGHRILETLQTAGVDVVVLEIDGNGPFVAPAKAAGVPVLVRDMRDDQALIDAGVEHANTIIIATNADMANIEVAIDARRMNPKIRVLMRLFDQRIAQKLGPALHVDAAFSASALAAPLVAAMSLETRVLSSIVIGGVPHVVAEVKVREQGALSGKRVDEIERGYGARVLARVPAQDERGLQSPPSPATVVSAGDTLVFHTATSQMTTIAAAAGNVGNK